MKKSQLNRFFLCLAAVVLLCAPSAFAGVRRHAANPVPPAPLPLAAEIEAIPQAGGGYMVFVYLNLFLPIGAKIDTALSVDGALVNTHTSTLSIDGKGWQLALGLVPDDATTVTCIIRVTVGVDVYQFIGTVPVDASSSSDEASAMSASQQQ